MILKHLLNLTMYMVQKFDAKFGVVAATAGYTVFQDGTLTTEGKFMGVDQKDVKELDDNKIWNVGVAFDLAKDLNLSANYMKSSEKISDK